MRQDEILSVKMEECEARIRHRRSISDMASLQQEKQNICDMIWDGILCWPSAKPGEILYQQCPSYLLGFDSSMNASKHCTSEGWWIHPDHNKTWTNFTECFRGGKYVTLAPFPEALPLLHTWVPLVKMISRIGYLISFISLMLACAILLSNRKLRCPRNVLHLHLFVSFLMRASMALLKDNLFEEGITFSSSIMHYDEDIRYTDSAQEWGCKAFTAMWQYSILANYSWILVEGLYLHNLIFMALFSDTCSIGRYIAFGWLAPATFVLAWAWIRVSFEDTLCWTTHQNRNLFLIIEIPIVISIVVNLILFVNIARVLLIKLSSSVDGSISRYSKWAKSTLVLMPLYGVHYSLFLGLSYSSNPVVEVIWLLCDQLFASSQGLFVSILYCIVNGEVVEVMKGRWQSLRNRFEKPIEHFAMNKVHPFEAASVGDDAASTEFHL